MIKHRYAVRGCPVPAICPGTLAELELALVHAMTTSKYLPDKPVTVWFDNGKDQRYIIRSYMAGQEIMSTEDAEEE